jgi:hypothetical protein
MRSERPQASGEEVSQAVREIRAYHDQGRQSLKELPERGKHGAGAIDAQAEALGWNATKLRKARQFAHREGGYSRRQLDELCRLIREYRPHFGTAHIGLLVTVAWREREGLQKECVEGDWSTSELQAEIKRRFGPRRYGGRRRRVSTEPGRVLLQLDGMAYTWERWSKIVEEEGEGGASILDSLPEGVRGRIEAVSRAVARLRVLLDEELKARRKKPAAKEG